MNSISVVCLAESHAGFYDSNSRLSNSYYLASGYILLYYYQCCRAGIRVFFDPWSGSGIICLKLSTGSQVQPIEFPPLFVVVGSEIRVTGFGMETNY